MIQNDKCFDKYLEERNNNAIDAIIRDLGFENPYTIKFCEEVEKNPTMGILQLQRLMAKIRKLAC